MAARAETRVPEVLTHEYERTAYLELIDPREKDKALKLANLIKEGFFTAMVAATCKLIEANEVKKGATPDPFLTIILTQCDKTWENLLAGESKEKAITSSSYHANCPHPPVRQTMQIHYVNSGTAQKMELGYQKKLPAAQIVMGTFAYILYASNKIFLEKLTAAEKENNPHLKHLKRTDSAKLIDKGIDSPRKKVFCSTIMKTPEAEAERIKLEEITLTWLSYAQTLQNHRALKVDMKVDMDEHSQYSCTRMCSSN